MGTKKYDVRPADAVSPFVARRSLISTLPGLTNDAYERLLPLVQPRGAARVADVLQTVRAAVLERSPRYDVRELELYADASEQLDVAVTAFLGFGAEAAAFRRERGGVLKFTHVELEAEHGRRPIDVPFTELQSHVVRRSGADTRIYSYVQRELDIVRDWDVMRRAMSEFRAAGFHLNDIKFGNVGFDAVTEKLLLCDYWGAIPLQ